MSRNYLQVDTSSLAAFCRQHGVAKLSLFGSVLRSDYDPHHSDIDVLVEFQSGAHKSLFKLLEMQRELSELFHRQVDLNTPGSLSKYFRDDVLASAQVLYDAA
jgi:predicted nucleotidyltransferase